MAAARWARAACLAAAVALLGGGAGPGCAAGRAPAAHTPEASTRAALAEPSARVAPLQMCAPNHGLSYIGDLECRTYSDADVLELLASVPGDGDELAALIETAAGTIECVLAPSEAPRTTANFIALVTGRRPWRDPRTGELRTARFYDGLSFHRIERDFVIQAGNPWGTKAGGAGYRFPREEGMASGYGRGGTLGMVDAGADTHGSQFFITVQDDGHLQGRYPAFGRCGPARVIRAISRGAVAPPASTNARPDVPLQPTRIREIRVERRRAPPSAAE